MSKLARVNLSVILVLALAAQICCNDENPAVSDDGGDSFDTIPMCIGVQWTYETYDSLSQTIDTLAVSIIDTVTIGSGAYLTVWSYREDADSSLRYVSIKGDTLAFYDDTLSVQPSEYFVFPLSEGRLWTGPTNLGDTSRVTEIGTIYVPAGEFEHGIRIDRIWDVDFEGGRSQSTTWLIPEVGIAFRHLLVRFSDGDTIITTMNEVWKLLSYDLGNCQPPGH